MSSDTAPVRMEKSMPDAYRLAAKPDGEVILQGAYFWSEGRAYGHVWREIPLVMLDEQGNVVGG